jgi:predicted dehydrogenase/nucleoside-diphosphate-sugar epimerase
MKVALIGAGNIATVHGPIVNNHPDAELVGIADRDLTRAESLAGWLNQCPCFDDAEAMLKETQPDVVHVLTPPASHVAVATLALEHGCHVLVEKPLAPNAAAARQIIDAAKANGRLMCVNHNMVFEHTVQEALEVFRGGSIGDLVAVEAVYQFDPRRYPAILEDGAERTHWTYGLNGGPLEDLMPHPASLICELLPEIAEVQVVGANRGWLPQGWWDEVRVLAGPSRQMGMGGPVGSISISLNARPDIITFTIKGTEGMVEADLFADTVVVRRKLGLPRAAVRGLSGFSSGAQCIKGGVNNLLRFGLGRMDKSNGVQPLVDRFYKAIQGKAALPVEPEASLKVVQLMQGIWPEPMKKIERSAKVKPTTLARQSEVLVTGASGFIGTYLVKELLARGKAVRALVRPNSQHLGKLQEMDVEIFEGDLADPALPLKAAQGIQTIYHAGSPMGNSWDEFKTAGVEATDRLLKASLAAGVERFVQFSTLNVYDLVNATKGALIDEDFPLQNTARVTGPYAWAKIKCEEMALRAQAEYGLGASVVRPAMVVGPQGRVFFPHLGFNFQDRTFVIIGGGRIELGITYVENLVDGVILAGTKPEAIGNIYNLVDDGTLTAREYIELFMETSGVRANIVNMPYAAIYGITMLYEAVSGLGLIKPGATSRDQLRWKQAKVRFPNDRAKNDLGWQPKVPLKEGLIKTFKWYADTYCK